MGRPPQFRSGGWRSRPAALASVLLAATFAVAERAGAQVVVPTVPASGAITVPLGQIARQASQTVQATGAAAVAVQVQPTNLAAPVALESPGTSTVIGQGNAAGAGAASANSSSTSQSAGQSKGGDAAPASPSAGTAGGHAPEPASGGPALASGQAGQTAQNAAAQAATVQAAPVNIAIPIAIGSPGSSIVIVQTNAASSGATADNSSSTTQTTGQAVTGSPALPGRPGAAVPVASAPTLAGPGAGAGATESVLMPAAPGTTWIWNWNWKIEIAVPSLRLPAFAPWAFPGDEAGTTAPARAKRSAPSPRRDGPASTREAAGVLDPAAAAPEAANGVSSNIVQRPMTAPEPLLKPFVALPLSPLPAPSAGSGFVPAGLLVGALAFLALYLGSLGLLLGRLSLASAPWRQQAYLAPLQRPG